MTARRTTPASRTRGPRRGGGVAALVLAAGRSERMGRPKPLVVLGGKPILAHVLDALRAGGIREIVVVLGSEADRIRREIALDGTRPIVHRGYAEGMSSSIRAGMAVVSSAVDAFLIVLGDQPLVAPSTFRALASWHASKRTEILVPTYAGVRGNPVLLPRALSEEIASVRGDVGCREVVRRHPRDTEEVPVDDPGILLDVDTPEDAERIEGALANRTPLEDLVHDRIRGGPRRRPTG